MKFCSHCGSDQLRFDTPDGDTRPRFWCPACGTIHYQNPRIVVGTLPTWEGRILLCRRAIQPRRGFWTLPAGFMENGETLQEGAARETWEEACATVNVTDLYTVFNLPHIYQVHVFFLGHLADGRHAAGDESLETALFLPDDLPWNHMAFPTVSRTLRLFLQDRPAGRFPIRVQEINPQPGLD